MEPSRHPRAAAAPTVSLKDMLVAAGLRPRIAKLVEDMPHRVVTVDPRRTFREPGTSANEVIFVRSGILAKYRTGGSGRRQIVAVRFPGEGILPRDVAASYGIQAIVKSEVMIGRGEDFDAIVDAHPELQRFFRILIQRNEAISYEWLVNCGRRDSTARVAHFLCETAVRAGVDGDGCHLVNPFTQQQIADITGQTSVNVNRVFADLERNGLISRDGREITFSDWIELRRVASFQPTYLE